MVDDDAAPMAEEPEPIWMGLQEREQEAADLLALWGLCGGGCACGLGDECPMKGMKRCEYCGDIKKTVCRKKTCIEKSAPLLLTYTAPANDV